jgi:hypothetical protein
MARIDRDELRSMVRQALKETLGPKGDAPAEPAGDLASEIETALASGKPAKVKVATDLDAFARGILAASEDASLRQAILAGDVRFEIAGVVEPKPVAKGGTRGGSFHMESGVLGETKLVELARSHSKIVVGSDVVVTPLAREKARQLKVEIARQKP